MNYKILIISILLGGFSIIGASVYRGYSVLDAEVVDNAYESGLKFEENARQEARLGWHVELPRTLRTAGTKAVTVMNVAVLDRDGNGLKNATVELELNRMGNREVQTYQCTGGNDGRYTAPVVFKAPGYWEAKVHVAHLGQSLVFNNNIDVIQ